MNSFQACVQTTGTILQTRILGIATPTWQGHQVHSQSLYISAFRPVHSRKLLRSVSKIFSHIGFMFCSPDALAAFLVPCKRRGQQPLAILCNILRMLQVLSLQISRIYMNFIVSHHKSYTIFVFVPLVTLLFRVWILSGAKLTLTSKWTRGINMLSAWPRCFTAMSFSTYRTLLLLLRLTKLQVYALA